MIFWKTCGILVTLGIGFGHSLGIWDVEILIPRPAGPSETAILSVVFPDSIGNTDTRLLLTEKISVGNTFYPKGRLDPEEKQFLEGLRALTQGNAVKTAELWSAFTGKKNQTWFRSFVNVDQGLLLCMRGEIGTAELLWKKELQHQTPAWEGAWRNLVGLYASQGHLTQAESLLSRIAIKQPRNRAIAVARAGLVSQLRPDFEFEEFLKNNSQPQDSLPEIQLSYGEFLVRQKRWQESIHYLDWGLDKLSLYGRGWRLLAEAQYHLGYQVFALACLENAFRAGYRESDLYELFAQVLRACCMAVEDERSVNARKATEHLLEEGLPKDLHRRSMAQLLYHVYCQNSKPDAALRLEKELWFHFEGIEPFIPEIGFGLWNQSGLESQKLNYAIGLFSLPWIKAAKDGKILRGF